MTTYIFVIASEEILKEYYCCCPHLRSLYCDPNPLNEVLDFAHSCSLSDAKGTIHTDVLRSRTCGRTAILNCNLQCVVVFKCISLMERKGYNGIKIQLKNMILCSRAGSLDHKIFTKESIPANGLSPTNLFLGCPRLLKFHLGSSYFHMHLIRHNISYYRIKVTISELGLSALCPEKST